MRTFFFLCGLCLLIWGSNELYQKKTRFGLLSKFASPTFAPSEEWNLPLLSKKEQKKVNQILSQPFTYLARGSQAFAFVSKDGKYVLKLFKQHKWYPKNIWGYLPIPFNPYFKDYLQRQKKQRELLQSCKTALLHVKEDTGVIFAHLNPTPLDLAPAILIDKRGKLWTLDLSKSCFLLQKKADLFYPYIQELMKRGDEKGAQDAITSTFDLLERFIKKGVFENNAILRKNFGFIDGKAVQFDIGKFKFDPSRKKDIKEIRVVVERFRCWLERNYPQLLSHFDTRLEELCPLGSL